MSGSTEFLSNANHIRPPATYTTSTKTHKNNVINHFQQNATPTQKAPSSGPSTKSHNSQYKSDSRTTVRNHVQFVLPLNNGSYNSRSNTPTRSDNFFEQVLTPTNSNSSMNNRLSEFKNLNIAAESEKREASKSIGNGLNRLSDTARLKNLTSIRSSSFRGKNSIPIPTAVKYEPSSMKARYDMQPPISNSGSDAFTQKTRSSKSYESINTIKDLKLEKKQRQQEQQDAETNKSMDVSAHTHTIHRLIKMATNWSSSSSKSKSSKADSAGKPKYIMSDRSLISQTKIRKTQAFLGENGNKMDAESAMSRKMAEMTEKTIKVVSQPSFDEAFSDAMSDKSVRVFNSTSRTPSHPIRILPMSQLNRLSETNKDMADGPLNSPHHTKKTIANILRDTHNFSNHKESATTNSYWSAASNNDIMPLNDAGSMSTKESSISSYLGKNKSISFMHLNKNLSSAFKSQSGSNGGLNRIPQGVPIHIQ